MIKQSKLHSKIVFLTALAAFAIVVIALPGCSDKPDEPAVTENPAHGQPGHVHDFAPVENPVTNPKTQENPQYLPADKTPTLREIIAAKWGWQPRFTEWDDKIAPNFSVTDIDGKVHKLSDYRGKEVILIFWGTWCPYCLREIPSFIQLRKDYPEKELAILAISYVMPNDSVAKVKQARKKLGMNYPLAHVTMKSMPIPFNAVDPLPGAFFIDKHGIIKLATKGVVPSNQKRQIIKAIK